MATLIPDYLVNAGVAVVIRSTGYTPASGRPLRVIVLHYAVTAETPSAAEGVANYFRTGVKASSHFTTDNDSTVFQVPVEDVAWAAPGANHDGIQIEQAGTTQTREQWLDDYSTAMLDRTARLVVALALEHDIPLEHLTDAQLAAGHKGIVDHWAVTRVYHGSDHTDLGTGFPWDYFMSRVAHFANQSEEDDMPSLEELGALLDKKLSVRLTDAQKEAIGTGQDVWPVWKAVGYACGQVARIRGIAIDAAKDAAAARSIAEKQALKGAALTAEEVEAAAAQGTRRALSEAAKIKVEVTNAADQADATPTVQLGVGD